MNANHSILLISDRSDKIDDNIDDVVSRLETMGINLNLVHDPEIGRHTFKQKEPHVLLLNFDTLEEAKIFYLNCLSEAESEETRLHQTILCCAMSEAKAAADFVIKRMIDDYFVLKPIYDPNRLHICIQHALDRRMAQINSLSQASSESQADSATAENPIREGLQKICDFRGESAQAHTRLVEGIEGKLDQFEQKLSQPEFRDVVNVIDKAKLSQHFSRLKNEELQDDFDTFEKEFGDSHNRLLTELEEYIQQDDRQVQKHSLPERQPSPSHSDPILIIDDDPESIDLLTAMLEPEGYTINHATQTTQAVILGIKEEPALILMDVMMPHVNGLELTRRFNLTLSHYHRRF